MNLIHEALVVVICLLFLEDNLHLFLQLLHLILFSAVGMTLPRRVVDSLARRLVPLFSWGNAAAAADVAAFAAVAATVIAAISAAIRAGSSHCTGAHVRISFTSYRTLVTTNGLVAPAAQRAESKSALATGSVARAVTARLDPDMATE